MERQDDNPRAYPDREAGRREHRVPEEGSTEGSAAADADREYSDKSSEQTLPDREQPEGSREYADSGREYTEAGRDESVEASPTSESQPVRQPGAEEYAAGDRPVSAEDASRAAPASYAGEQSPAQRHAGDPAEAQSVAGPGQEAAGMGTSQGDAAYAAAAERQAVTPPSADGDQADAARADERDSGGLTGAGAQATPGAVGVIEQTAVLSRDDAQAFQVRWETIQGNFIDDPHAATEQADALVGEVMERLARLREDYVRQLRGAIGDGSDTEAMRVALQRYRAFFQMLLG
ncbi:MAG: hypothetical protein DLM58_11975 [Pseudonocardiales bacterium]|nr:hypothetical protein [Candidatus Dormibacteraeota bacterium]PZS31310.1 MAG: hypothetical protein DLM58_11975 [Pseudonocardiales bacterium]